MIRNFKALGLALVAVLAMSAVVASAAQATTVSAEGYTTTLTGTQSNENIFKVGGVRSVSCAEATLTSSLTGPSASVTASAAYAKCTSVPSSLPATVNMKSCTYVVTPGTPDGTGTTGSGTIAVQCSVPGDEIHVTVYKDAAHKEVACTYAVKAQTPTSASTYHNIGAGTTREIEITASLSAISTKVITGTKLLCGGAAGETVSSTYTGNIKVTGENAAKQHVGIFVSH